MENNVFTVTGGRYVMVSKGYGYTMAHFAVILYLSTQEAVSSSFRELKANKKRQ